MTHSGTRLSTQISRKAPGASPRRHRFLPGLFGAFRDGERSNAIGLRASTL